MLGVTCKVFPGVACDGLEPGGYPSVLTENPKKEDPKNVIVCRDRGKLSFVFLGPGGYPLVQHKTQERPPKDILGEGDLSSPVNRLREGLRHDGPHVRGRGGPRRRCAGG